MSVYSRFIHSWLVGYISNFIPDELYLKIKFKMITGKTLHLSHPETFNEKIQWLKLNDRNLIYPKLADKCEAKKIISGWIGEKYIIPTIKEWNHYEELNFDELPDKFVIKTTHDSGGVVICDDKSLLDTEQTRRMIYRSFKRDYYKHGREWSYKGLVPRIIVEPLLVDESGFELKDYKVFCFSGNPKYIQVDYDRFIDHHRNFYSTEWEYVPFTTMYPTNPDKCIERPKVLEELLELCRKINDHINNPPFVRIDFYIVKDHIYFGEVTFYHGSGTEMFIPESYDKKLGDMIDLSKINTNVK